MRAGDTQPTQPLPEWMYAEPAPARRRRVWPWIVALIVVVGLLVVVWFVVDSVARQFVTTAIRQQVVTRLELPADQDVEVAVDGPMIPQLIRGTLEEVTISAADVAFASFAGDVTVVAEDVSLAEGGSVSAASATIVLNEEQLRTLLSTVEGFPAASLGIAAPDVTMSTELSLFGIAVPIAVALTPSVADGDIVLTPSSLELSGAEITADALTERFGGLADAVLRDWTVCIAQYIPAGVTVSDVAVTGDQVVVDLDIDGAIIRDRALQEPGVCA